MGLFPITADDSIPKRALLRIINIIITPFLLIFRYFVHYVFPWAYLLIGGLLDALFCHSCNKLFTDVEFPTNATSLGKADTDVEWIRLQDLEWHTTLQKYKHDDKCLSYCSLLHTILNCLCLSRKTTIIDGNIIKGKCNRLFNHNVVASDICQGALGDCWLLAACAVLAEKPELILNCFKTRVFTTTGKYVIRLYDRKASPPAFKDITIDDFIPCKKGKPMYCQLKSNEIWPLLLEKAFAKLHGSYCGIEGGIPLHAMIAMTGYEGIHIEAPFGERLTYEKLLRFHKKGYLIGAGTSGVDNTRKEGRDAVQGSIVGGHAYSVLAVSAPHLTTANVKLVKIRNPWGSFSWKGDWSADSALWGTHPGVALEMGRGDNEEGVFYMQWDDVLKYYDMFDIVMPSYGTDYLHLDVKEADGPILGVCTGCLTASGRFWCLCRGLTTMWMETKSVEERNAVIANLV
jgi:hypothetical protein